jgi:uracil-DNA glycosylase
LIAGAWQVKTPGMIDAAKSGLAETVAAAFEWWRDAGVDRCWEDQPQSWIAPPEPPAQEEASPSPAAIVAPAPIAQGPDRSNWPTAFDAFFPYWLEDQWLDTSPREARVAPRGPAGAEVMVLVGEPEQQDSDRLLSGPQGRLLDAMLAAMGIEEAQVYRASILPRATPHADWAALGARGLGELALHHIGLAAPKRLIAFGGHILPLLGHDPANNLPISTEVNHGSGKIPMLAARDLAVLLERPRWKARFWQSWLEWTRDVM